MTRKEFELVVAYLIVIGELALEVGEVDKVATMIETCAKMLSEFVDDDNNVDFKEVIWRKCAEYETEKALFLGEGLEEA